MSWLRFKVATKFRSLIISRYYFRCNLKIAKNEAKKVYKNNALVAQLDRALDYESRGQGFESSRAHHIKTHY